MEKLAKDHNPVFVPDDANAPERWDAITTVYQILTDKDRKKFYDFDHRTPATLKGVDFAALGLDYMRIGPMD